MSKQPIILVDPVLLSDQPTRVRPAGAEGVPVVRNVHVVNTSNTKVRLYLCKSGRDAGHAWYWGTLMNPGHVLDWDTFKMLGPDDTLEAWADVADALCLSVDGTLYPFPE